MSAKKDLAIVLRVIEFSETSCVVTLFTRQMGKISALAKGARRPKSPFEAALDVLALCRIVFLHKSSDSLDLLTEARLQRRFRSAEFDLSRLYAGYYIAELLKELTDADDPHPELFDAANQALRELDNHCEVAPLVLRMEMTALRLLGHAPSLELCVGCDKKLEPASHVLFGQLAGGVLCNRCRSGQRQVVRLSSDAIRTLQHFCSTDEETWRNEGIPSHVRGELRGLINQYLSNLLGHQPRMHAYLGVLSR